MRLFTTLSCLGVTCIGRSQHLVHARRLGEDSDDVKPCPKITTDPAFDMEALKTYVSKRWFVHEQAVTTYLPIERNYCVTAEYKLLPSKTFWGYSLEVNNKAKNADGEDFGGILYAAQTNENTEPAKLEVAPGFLPRFLAGPYWILEYQESDETSGEEGYALIIGGQPTVRTPADGPGGLPGGCKTKNRWITSSGGLWIFTRSPVRNETLIAEIKERAVETYDLDVNVLNPVSHTAVDCEYEEIER